MKTQMINRFMRFIFLSNAYKNQPSILNKYRRDYSKKSILNDIKEKSSFSPNDLIGYTWIIKYGQEKFKESNLIPTDIEIFNFDGKGCCFKYGNISNPNNYQFEVKCEVPNSDFSIVIRIKNKGIFTTSNCIKSWDEEEKPIFDIIKTCTLYSLEEIMNKISEGD